jgi:hypothetical protein
VTVRGIQAARAVAVDLAPRVRRRPRPATVRSLRRQDRPNTIRLLPGWPLTVLCLGYPLWWAVGLATLGFLVAAVPMAVFLLRRRSLVAPRGFALWLMFLVWVVAGITTLWMDVPGAQTAQGIGRLLPFSYKLAWYVAATVVLLYIGNTREEEVPSRKLFRLLGVLFLVTVAGGYLGWLFPQLEFRSLLERLLPAGAASNNFVQILIHPAAAQVQGILGYDWPRPKAPYSFANDWGANFGLLLPFFVVAWAGPGAGRRRRYFPLVTLLAVPPAIVSLNRGLWLGVLAMAVYATVRLAARGRLAAMAGLAAASLATVVLLAVTPLGGLLQERLAAPHSNQGRLELSSRAVAATADASPVLGFGSTREVEGNFFSIAGAASALCPECSPPQLGTQGHLWNLIFVHGFVGAGLFLGFVYLRFALALRDNSFEAIALTSCGVFFTVVMLVYDLIGPPLAITMIALGLLWRRERTNQAATPDRTATE